MKYMMMYVLLNWRHHIWLKHLKQLWDETRRACKNKTTSRDKFHNRLFRIFSGPCNESKKKPSKCTHKKIWHILWKTVRAKREGNFFAHPSIYKKSIFLSCYTFVSLFPREILFPTNLNCQLGSAPGHKFYYTGAPPRARDFYYHSN